MDGGFLTFVAGRFAFLAVALEVQAIHVFCRTVDGTRYGRICMGDCRSFDRRQPVTVQVKDAVPPGVTNTNSAGAPGVLNTSCPSR